jgi:hypothetical protein
MSDVELTISGVCDAVLRYHNEQARSVLRTLDETAWVKAEAAREVLDAIISRMPPAMAEQARRDVRRRIDAATETMYFDVKEA